MSRPLPIHEVFTSWQGEGVHSGQKAFFIRTFGCALQCPWCDSAGTWHPDYVPAKVHRFTPEALVEAALRADPAFVVVTGGEPTHHDLTELTLGLHRAGLRVHLETSGAYPIQGTFDWITVSPKVSHLPLAENLRKAHEWKLIVEGVYSVANWMTILRPNHLGQPIFLHPQWGERDNPAILNAITQAVLEDKRRSFRAGYQIHKLYRADVNDSRSAPPAPLGGIPAQGF